MRTLLIFAVLAMTAATGACTCGDQWHTGADATFYWNSRLVPMTAAERTMSGTGKTEDGTLSRARMQ